MNKYAIIVILILWLGLMHNCFSQAPIGDWRLLGNAGKAFAVQVGPNYNVVFDGKVVFAPDSGLSFRYYIYNDSIVFGNYIPDFARHRSVDIPYHLVVINIFEPLHVYCMRGFEYKLEKIDWETKEVVIHPYGSDTVVVKEMVLGPCKFTDRWHGEN